MNDKKLIDSFWKLKGYPHNSTQNYAIIDDGIRYGYEQGKKDDVMIINKYFKDIENVDVYICGCGCNQRFDVISGFAERIRLDLLKELMKDPKGSEQE